MAQRSPFPPAGSNTAAHAANPNPPPVKDSFQRLVDGLQTLFREHLALARLELRDDLKRIVRDVAFSAAGVPLLFVGYTLLMVAASLAIALALPAWLGFLIVAVVNLAAGGALAAMFGRRIGKTDKVELPKTSEEFKRDKEWVAALKTSTRPQPIPGDGAALAATNGSALATGEPVPLPGPRDGHLPSH